MLPHLHIAINKTYPFSPSFISILECCPPMWAHSPVPYPLYCYYNQTNNQIQDKMDITIKGTHLNHICACLNPIKKVKYEENCGKCHVTLEQSLEIVHANILTCLCALSLSLPSHKCFPSAKRKEMPDGMIHDCGWMVLLSLHIISIYTQFFIFVSGLFTFLSSA